VHVSDQLGLIIRNRRWTALGRTVLPDQAARLALRHPVALYRFCHGSPATGRAQKFPSAMSFKTLFSRA